MDYIELGLLEHRLIGYSERIFYLPRESSFRLMPRAISQAKENLSSSGGLKLLGSSGAKTPSLFGCYKEV